MGRPVVDRTGKKYGRLTAIAHVASARKTKHAIWECQCDCGKIVQVDGGHLHSGSIRSCGCSVVATEDEIRKRFEDKFIPEPNSGCWLWTAVCHKQGYGSFSFRGRSTGAHRVSWTLYVGPIPDGMDVLHRCDNTYCVNPGHLFIGTHDDNMADMNQKGRNHLQRVQRGERPHPRQKLKPGQLEQIKAAPGVHSKIADEYGVSRAHVSAIKRKANQNGTAEQA